MAELTAGAQQGITTMIGLLGQAGAAAPAADLTVYYLDLGDAKVKIDLAANTIEAVE